MRCALAVLLALAAATPLAGAQGGCPDFHLSPSQMDVDADRGNGVFHVSGPDGCTYRVFGGENWLAFGQDRATIRDRAVAISVYWERNVEAYGRTGSVHVATDSPDYYQAATLTVVQAPPRDSCVLSVSPTSFLLTAEGGSRSVEVSTFSDTCEWSLYSGLPWIGMPYGTHAGSAQVSLQVEPNDGEVPRSGQVTIGGTAVTIHQESIAGERPPGYVEPTTPKSRTPEEAVVDWVGADAPGPEAALVMGAVGLAAALALRRR